MAKPSKPESTAKEPITGVAYIMQAVKDQGFNNFRICALFIENGEIVHVEKSQPYAAFEALAKADHRFTLAHWELNSRFKDGLYMGMGGEDKVSLLSRLDPKTIKKISNALAIEVPKNG